MGRGEGGGGGRDTGKERSGWLEEGTYLQLHADQLRGLQRRGKERSG